MNSVEQRRANEDHLWMQYAEKGELPTVPVLKTNEEIESARALLTGPYNNLQKLLYGEALAKIGLLSEIEESSHVESSKWVFKMTYSKKQNYDKKEEMRSSLSRFKLNSKNQRLNLLGKFELAKDMLKDKTDTEKVPYGEKLLSKLNLIIQENQWVKDKNEFIDLLISIGWTLIKGERLTTIDKYTKLLNMADSNDNYLAQSITALKEKIQFLQKKPILDWQKNVKSALSERSEDAKKKLELLEQAHYILRDGVIKQTLSQGESRYYFLFYVTRIIKSYKINPPLVALEQFLKIMKYDGLEDLPRSCYERKEKETNAEGQSHPHQQKEYWPSLVEDIAKNIYRSIKICTNNKQKFNLQVSNLTWAINFCKSVYNHFQDDKWGDYRIGKLLIWSGDIKQASDFLLPIIRKKQSDFWAWDLLGDLYPNKIKACIAQALLCKCQEDEYLVNIKKKASELGLDIENEKDLLDYAKDANELILAGIEPINGVLLEKFKTKEGKNRMVFSDGSSRRLKPVSLKSARMGSNSPDGTPVTLYLNPENKEEIIAVKRREEGASWDVFPIKNAIFIEQFNDKKGNLVAVVATANDSMYYYGTLDKMRQGCPLKIRILEKDSRLKCIYLEKDLSPNRREWDVMQTIPAIFLESYQDQKGNNVSLFTSNHIQYRYYGKINQLTAGSPVDIVIGNKSNSQSKKCYHFSISSNRHAWDLLDKARAIYCGKNRTGNSFIFSDGTRQYNMLQNRVKSFDESLLGEEFEITYTTRQKDNRLIYDVYNCQRMTSPSLDLTIKFSGEVRISNNENGYVDSYSNLNDGTETDTEDSILVTSEQLQKFHIKDGDVITGVAVMFQSQRGRKQYRMIKIIEDRCS